ncbi:hypothetical protein R3P38DRAFT_3243517 [Favolaschia claudopus]|uniref:Uncharacterized protein n=1 Tax=Favolaschia claudopus TaxID=2862362 RepID=A0AAV9Z384_9AGAR
MHMRLPAVSSSSPPPLPQLQRLYRRSMRSISLGPFACPLVRYAELCHPPFLSVGMPVLFPRQTFDRFAPSGPERDTGGAVAGGDSSPSFILQYRRSEVRVPPPSLDTPPLSDPSPIRTPYRNSADDSEASRTAPASPASARFSSSSSSGSTIHGAHRVPSVEAPQTCAAVHDDIDVHVSRLHQLTHVRTTLTHRLSPFSPLQTQFRPS